MRRLSDLKGQPAARFMIESYIKNGLPPLLIFYGKDGVGKTSAAEALARETLCRTRNACGSCDACIKLAQGSHADFIYFPENRIYLGKEKDPEPYTIRWLLRTRVIYSPFDGDMRIVLFPKAHMLQVEAQNVLLKVLEEPPPQTYFVIIAKDETDLLATVMSRGVKIPFQLLAYESMKEIVPGLSKEVWELSGGSLDVLPMVSSTFFGDLKERVQNAYKNASHLLDLEEWLVQSEKKRDASMSDMSLAEYFDMMTYILLFESQSIQDNPKRDQVRRAILDYKEKKNRELDENLAIHPILWGRLFQSMGAALFHHS